MSLGGHNVVLAFDPRGDAADGASLPEGLKQASTVIGHIRDTTQQGPRILKAYLEYALTGRLDPGQETDREPDSDFEVAVANRLGALGYEVIPQLGVAGFFLDLVVRHPEFPDTYLIGIECDGATYHSAKSARDRDRLREEILRNLGWMLYRI